MKRPNVGQIRAALNRRRVHEAEVMARSDAIMDARIGVAVNTLVAERERDLEDFDAAVEALNRQTAIDTASRRSGSRSN